MTNKKWIFMALLVYSFNVCNTQEPVVNTTLGFVRGVVATDGDYTMYLGIPYAQVDADNPFGAAIPQTEFEDIFEANDDSAICPQEEEFNHTIVGSLDCLHLNIHVPSSASPNNLLPVFVSIYGGGFSIGFYGRYLYGAKYLVRHDIVLVTLNYRLGPYGFMNLNTPEVPGNQGLKDQLIALRWLHENIAAFGGDPNKITIGGNSAGGMSSDHLLLRRNGPQLFQQVIFQSGTALVSPPAQPNIEAPLLIAQHLGLTSSDTAEAIDFLAKADPLAVIATSLELNLSFSPTIEEEFTGVEALITDNWVRTTTVPAARDMPIMIGFTSEELLSVESTGILGGSMAVPIFLSMAFDFTHEEFPNLAEVIQQFFFGDEELNDFQKRNFIDFSSDLVFVHPIHRSIKKFLENDVGNVYLYKFSYSGGRNFVKDKNNLNVVGAAHADELGYLFDISYMDEPSPDDQLVVDAMTTTWANFVKYGDPTPEITPLLPHKWEAITKDSAYHYMDIGNPLNVATRPFNDRMAFWDLIYETYGHFQQGYNL